MTEFLIVDFKFRRALYKSLILCKRKNDSAEYRVTVMNGALEKKLCSNNIIEEQHGQLNITYSADTLHNRIKMKIAKALGKIVGKRINKFVLRRRAKKLKVLT